MANVGTAASGMTLIGAGNGVSPTFVNIGTNSGLTAHGVVIAEGNGAFVATSAGTATNVLTSNGGSLDPTFQPLPFTQMPWTDESSAFNALAGNGYFIAGSCTGTLPTSPSNGNIIAFFVDGAFTLTIQANTGQTIKISSNVSSSAGTQANTASGDAVTLVYRATNTRWEAINFVGAWNFT